MDGPEKGGLLGGIEASWLGRNLAGGVESRKGSAMRLNSPFFFYAQRADSSV
jgi:hypothetical protein